MKPVCYNNIVDIEQMMLDLSQLVSLGCSKKMEESLFFIRCIKVKLVNKIV